MWTPRPAPILGTNEGFHNTSLLPNKQLVRELKLWIALLKVLDRLPGGFSSYMALPLNKKFPLSAVQTSMDNLRWSRYHSAMEDGWQWH
jgi:hypothetical protein